MIRKGIMRLLIFIIFLISLFQSVYPETREHLEGILGGDPVHLGSNLDEISYVDVHTKRLKNAQIVWFNFDLAREMGIAVPADGMNPEFEQMLLDELAYMIPNQNDSPETFLQNEKIFKADKYGGMGIGTNLGSGRAASAGKIQIKGIGVTSLVSKSTPFDHAHGGASMKESIQEAVWGEINHHELSQGSNRVLAIIDPGTYTVWGGSQSKEARGLIVRQDPLRPAHYVSNSADTEVDDVKRLIKMREKLSYALPQKKGEKVYSSIDQKFEKGLDELIDRLARQFASSNARKIFHGAASTSNIQLDAKYLDFGTETSLPDHGNAQVLSFLSPFQREVYDHSSNTINKLLQSYYHGLDYRTLGMKQKGRYDQLKSRYEKYLATEFVELTGIPKNIILKIQNGNDQELKKFGESLILFAYYKEDFELFFVDKEMPSQMTTYNLGKILTLAADHQSLDSELLAKELSQILPEENARSFALDYINFYKKALKIAYDDGVEESAFKKMVAMRVRRINENREELYRSNLTQSNIAIIDQYKKDHNRSKIWDYINKKISSQRRTYRDEEPYKVILGEHKDDLYASKLRYIYDAREDRYLVEYSIGIHDGKMNYQGRSISRTDVSRLKFNIKLKDGQSYSSKGRLENTHVIFELPSGKNPGELEMIMFLDNTPVGGINRAIFNLKGADLDCLSLIHLFF